MPGHRHPGAQEHVLLALEAVLASLAFEAPPAECGPEVLRAACPVSATALVADPRTTQQVFEQVQWTLRSGAGERPAAPVLVTITLDESTPGRITVNFLRN
ncbi:MAG TPA: hypothetical protein VLL51_08985 [Gemmatimonadales bacterium]|nr:hypothetical protein [Gemmatimonadales bacterium]